MGQESWDNLAGLLCFRVSHEVAVRAVSSEGLTGAGGSASKMDHMALGSREETSFPPPVWVSVDCLSFLMPGQLTSPGASDLRGLSLMTQPQKSPTATSQDPLGRMCQFCSLWETVCKVMMPRGRNRLGPIGYIDE